jgi:uncharacterized protein YbjT (DUF2867 family)
MGIASADVAADAAAMNQRTRVLVVGATGMIGSAIVARLKTGGTSVVAIVRSKGSDAFRLAADDIRVLDLRKVRHSKDWLPYLEDVDAVINCAGVLQDGGRDDVRAVQEQAPAALFEACQGAGVRRLIHFSAMGVNQGALSMFSATKASAEIALERSRLDWLILRPSVVVGRSAYGGSALFRGLAALPWYLSIRGAGRLSIVQLDDVVETVVRLLSADAPSRVAVDLAGPDQLTFEEVVARYRRWLGWPPARAVSLSEPLMSAGYALGDIAGHLGWRPPIRSTARREMRRGAASDPAGWTTATGIVPRSLEHALLSEPASVEERWFARLFFVKPIVIGILSAFWLLTGFVSLGPGFHIGRALMVEGGAGPLSAYVVAAGGFVDLLIGAGIVWRRTTKYALWAAIALTMFYIIAGTAILPRLWEEPLGPMMKIWPILALNLVALSILDDR